MVAVLSKLLLFTYLPHDLELLICQSMLLLLTTKLILKHGDLIAELANFGMMDLVGLIARH